MTETHDCDDSRTITIGVVQGDGSIANVTMQVVNIRDANGDELRFSDADVLTAIYQELRYLRQMYGRATGQGAIDLPVLTGTGTLIG